MEYLNLKNHWDNVYQTKSSNQLSWTQETPDTSLHFITQLQLPKNAEIIDIGGGDSRLVDYLLAEGFENITVLDISETAIEKSKSRLGEKTKNVNWIVGDILTFETTKRFDVWHDRAAFHFLTTDEAINRYLSIARKSVQGYIVMGMFSENGPTRCSGLPVQQYSEETLAAKLTDDFKKIRCIVENHTTPFNTLQSFLFCIFKRENPGAL